MHQMELKESTRGGRNEVMLEWDLQHLRYSGRPGRAETEQVPSSLPQLCHTASGQASLEQVSAALLSPSAVKLTKNQDSSVMLSLARTCLLLGKGVLLLSSSLPATTMALLSLSNGTLRGFEMSGTMWFPAKREEWSREPFSSQLSGDSILTALRL